MRAGLTALAPGPGPLAAALKLLGLGGAAGGGAASSGAAAGGGAIVVAGGGTAAKVTAVVCCAALAAGRRCRGHAQDHRAVAWRQRCDGVAQGDRPSAAAAGAIPGHRIGSSAAVVAGGAAGAVGSAAADAKRDAAAGVDSATAEITRNTTSPTRAMESSPTTAAGVDHADEVTGGSAAPDEESGFGHGVDGLTPRSEMPAGGSQASSQATGPTANGGTTAPADAPAAVSGTVEPVHGNGRRGRDRAGIVQVAS